MRLRSDIVVSALIRRVFSQGGFAAVARKGADAAGAIFVRQLFRDGLETLYGPAPQSFMIDENSDGDRLFEIRLARNEPAELDALVEREARFDGDLWVVEIETDEIGSLVTVAGG